MVMPDSLEGTINTIAGDPKVGGASSGLVVHNATDNAVTRLASTIYWCELYITRSLPGSIGKSDCQSGPCAAFRLSALRPLLMPWYNQMIFGKRMVSLLLCLARPAHHAREGLLILCRSSTRTAISRLCFSSEAGASSMQGTS